MFTDENLQGLGRVEATELAAGMYTFLLSGAAVNLRHLHDPMGFTDEHARLKAAADTETLLAQSRWLYERIAALEANLQGMRPVWRALEGLQSGSATLSDLHNALAAFGPERPPLAGPDALFAFPCLAKRAGVFQMAVPTCTVIIRDDNDPYRVAVIEHAAKHNGRLTNVGGKHTGNISAEECAREEFDQEVGGKGAQITSLRFWGVKTDRFADVRVVTLHKATDGLCPPELAQLKVEALYGVPDHLYVATVSGELAPKDGEAKSVRWVDVRDIRATPKAADSLYGAQHDLLLIWYRRQLQGGIELDVEELTDLTAYRAKLLALGE